MPPAFNLSQDQTLQFDLELLIKELKKLETSFVQFHHERLKSMRPRVIADSWHPSSNAHAYRLLIFKELSQANRCLLRRADLLSAQKRNSKLLFNSLSSTRFSLRFANRLHQFAIHRAVAPQSQTDFRSAKPAILCPISNRRQA